MSDSITTPPQYSISKSSIHIPLAILTTAYLFYLDEGYYNFNWMKDPGNWFIFALYSAGFIALQSFVKYLLSKIYNGKYLSHLVSLSFLALVCGMIFYIFKG